MPTSAPLPSGTRYLQFRIFFDSTIESAVALDYLEFDYDEPLVSGGVVAEVFPPRVALGEEVTLRYFLRPFFADGEQGGFNRIELTVPDASTRVDTFKFDGRAWEELVVPLDADPEDPLLQVEPMRLEPEAGSAFIAGQFAQTFVKNPATGETRLLVKIPLLGAEDFIPATKGLLLSEAGQTIQVLPTGADSLYLRFPSSLNADLGPDIHALVEVQFTSRTFREGAQFASFVRSSTDLSGFFQRVDAQAQDATELVASGTARASLQTIGNRLINDVQAARVFTPNGDGINDVLQDRFVLLRVLEERPLDIVLLRFGGRATGSGEGRERGTGGSVGFQLGRPRPRWKPGATGHLLVPDQGRGRQGDRGGNFTSPRRVLNRLRASSAIASGQLGLHGGGKNLRDLTQI